MDTCSGTDNNTDPRGLSRREFLGGSLVLAGLPLTALQGAAQAVDGAGKPPEFARKVKLGLIGCGGRGMWIAKLFQAHGGFTIHAVADYFEDVAQRGGEALGVDKTRRFSGLSGYKRLLESGVEAVDIVDVPYFYPEQARDAVAAGMHVYMAKPVAVDVPGTMMIGEAGKTATAKQRCFLVDYQLPRAPAMEELGKRFRAGALGRLAHISSVGFGWQGWPDPPLGQTLESRLTKQIWLSDTALSGDTIVSYDIHIIDGLLSVVGGRPIAAYGRSRTCRPQPHGDRTDVAAVIYECEDGVIWTHVTQAISNNFDPVTLSVSLFGMDATAHIEYGAKVYIRGGKMHYSGNANSVFNEGVVRNIADFHRNITEGNFDNPSVQRAVDGTLTAILGREAAARRGELTMARLIEENRKLEADLTGLKA